MPLLLSQPQPPAITCGDLASLKVPVTLAYGELSRPLFSVVSRAAARCIPGQHLVVRGVTHMWPEEDAAAFCAAVLGFIKER